MTRNDWKNTMMALAEEQRWRVVLHILTNDCVFTDEASITDEASTEQTAAPPFQESAPFAQSKWLGEGRWRAYHEPSGRIFRFSTREAREQWIAVWTADKLGAFERSAGRESTEALREAA